MYYLSYPVISIFILFRANLFIVSHKFSFLFPHRWYLWFHCISFVLILMEFSLIYYWHKIITFATSFIIFSIYIFQLLFLYSCLSRIWSFIVRDCHNNDITTRCDHAGGDNYAAQMCRRKHLLVFNFWSFFLICVNTINLMIVSGVWVTKILLKTPGPSIIFSQIPSVRISISYTFVNTVLVSHLWSARP